jgi:hypothetical protein
MGGWPVQMTVIYTGHGLCTGWDGWMVTLCDNVRKWVLSMTDMNNGIICHW